MILFVGETPHREEPDLKAGFPPQTCRRRSNEAFPLTIPNVAPAANSQKIPAREANNPL
jgi:hypothetical protein